MATARTVARFGGVAATVPVAAPPQVAADMQRRDRTGGFGLSLAPVRTELTDAVTTGRLTLSVVLALTLGLIGFYYATRSIQGGG